MRKGQFIKELVFFLTLKYCVNNVVTVSIEIQREKWYKKVALFIKGLFTK